MPSPIARAAVLSLLLGAPALAEDPTKRAFDADPHRLALSLDGGFVTETAAAAPEGQYGLAALLDYAARWRPASTTGS